MLFREALNIQKGVTAVIGSGGKTSLLHVLADELPGRVLLCTTTHMRPSDTYKTLFDPTREQIRQDWARVLCVGSPAEDGKLTAPAIPMSELAALADYVLVEADGARGLPLKAHAPWEPVIPPEANQVICVVGASGFGRPAAEAVHRPELWQETDTSPRSVAAMLSREGFAYRIYVNQCETPSAHEGVKELASALNIPVCAGSLWRREVRCLR